VTPKTKGVLVRSSSRVGYTDFAVNALRLNSIAASLRAQGWAIAEITAKTHNVGGLGVVSVSPRHFQRIRISLLVKL